MRSFDSGTLSAPCLLTYALFPFFLLCFLITLMYLSIPYLKVLVISFMTYPMLFKMCFGDSFVFFLQIQSIFSDKNTYSGNHLLLCFCCSLVHKPYKYSKSSLCKPLRRLQESNGFHLFWIGPLCISLLLPIILCGPFLSGCNICTSAYHKHSNKR